MSKKLNLKKEIEISIAAGVGIITSLILATLIYLFGNQARFILTEKNAELLESYLMIFSGFFLAYVILSLHNLIRKNQGGNIIKIHEKLKNHSFDLSMFATIIFLVLREGFEIALFTASTSLFATFIQNFTGLLLGFVSASVVGLITFSAYIKFSISKIFKFTEYMIILLGASLVQNGLTELFKHGLNIELSKILSLPLNFLPEKQTLLGHMIRSFTGLDQEFSFVRLLIMAVYFMVIYLFFLRRQHSNLKTA